MGTRFLVFQKRQFLIPEFFGSCCQSRFGGCSFLFQSLGDYFPSSSSQKRNDILSSLTPLTPMISLTRRSLTGLTTKRFLSSKSNWSCWHSNKPTVQFPKLKQHLPISQDLSLSKRFFHESSSNENKRSISEEKGQLTESTTWQRFVTRVKHEANYYWSGSKLLFSNIRTASKILSRVSQGYAITRREKRLLVRTTADIFRVVPLFILVAIPFLELAIPIILRVFPRLLPTTFESPLQKEEASKRLVAVRLEVANFLQKTLAEMQIPKSTENTAQMKDLLRKVRLGILFSEEEIIQAALLFRDDITLESLDRSQLVSLCRFLGVSRFGPNRFLKYCLEKALTRVKEDDVKIRSEGIERLNYDELQQACRERGMKVMLSKVALQKQLSSWIELSLDKKLPASLLLLSRVFFYTPQIDPKHLRPALSSVSEKVLDEIEKEIVYKGSVETAESKILSLKSDEEEVERERREREREREGGERREREMGEKGEGVGEERVERREKEEEEERLRRVAEELTELVKDSSFEKEKKLLKEMKATQEVLEREEEEEVSPLFSREQRLYLLSHSSTTKEKEKRALDSSIQKVQKAKIALEQKVDEMLSRLQDIVEEEELSSSPKWSILDLDQDGFVSYDELLQANDFLKEKLTKEEFQKLALHLDPERNGLISVSLLKRFSKGLERPKQELRERDFSEYFLDDSSLKGERRIEK